MSDTLEVLALLSDSRPMLVGMKQVIKGLENGRVDTVLLASDADAFVARAVDEAAKKQGAVIYYVPSKAELGRRAGIQVDAACVGISGK